MLDLWVVDHPNEWPAIPNNLRRGGGCPRPPLIQIGGDRDTHRAFWRWLRPPQSFIVVAITIPDLHRGWPYQPRRASQVYHEVLRGWCDHPWGLLGVADYPHI